MKNRLPSKGPTRTTPISRQLPSRPGGLWRIDPRRFGRATPPSLHPRRRDPDVSNDKPTRLDQTSDRPVEKAASLFPRKSAVVTAGTKSVVPTLCVRCMSVLRVGSLQACTITTYRMTGPPTREGLKSRQDWLPNPCSETTGPILMNPSPFDVP